MYEEHGEGYTIYYANDKPKAPRLKYNEAGIGIKESTADNTRSSAQALRSDPNIEIVTKVPGLVWDIRYKVPPREAVKRHSFFTLLFGRAKKQES
ncbi:MAG: hypothetical protein M1500_03455 [Candidatus Marsarchaeota archaeon]|nr:hypothetical protein [Candidatus Marsarchaeota archaeon]